MGKKKEEPRKSKASNAGKPTSSRSRSINPPNPREEDEFTNRPKDELAEEEEEADPPADGEIQAPLIPETEMAALQPKAIQNGRMVSTYVGLGLERDKDNEKLVHLDFSLHLDQEHDGYLPAKIKEAFDWINATGNKSVQVDGIPDQTVDVFETPTERKASLHLSGATIVKATVSVVEQTGKGKAVKVIRLLFRTLVERNKKIIDFAAWSDGQQFWLTTKETQGRLL